MAGREINERMRTREELFRELARGDFSGVPAGDFGSEPLLSRLGELGTEVWIDTADLDQVRPLWRNECTALTTNNTLVNRVVQSGVMDGVIGEAVAGFRKELSGLDTTDLVRAVGFVVNARVALRLVSSFGCYVSVELHPDMAHNAETTVAYALLYHSVCPERFIIKIPLTPAGIVAARRLSLLGVPVNFTLGFSARQNYLVALFARPAYVNVFLGRLNQVVKDNGLGDGEYVGERATLASQRAVSEIRSRYPGIKTRQIAASFRKGRQVIDLAGVDVHTIPPTVLDEFYGFGLEPADLTSRLDEDYRVALSGGRTPEETSIDTLWRLDEPFLEFAREVSGSRADDLAAEDLVRESERFGLDLFYRFDDQEIESVRSGGKIPDLGEWSGRVALDDLMSAAALQSFASDQAALDDRIRSYL